MEGFVVPSYGKTAEVKPTELDEIYRHSTWVSVFAAGLIIFIEFQIWEISGVSKDPRGLLPYLGDVFLSMFLVVPVAFLSLSHTYQSIRITDETLQWHKFLEFPRTVPWSYVSDYYELTPSYGGIATVTHFIVTTQGNCTFLTNDFRHIDRLRRRIVQYAVNARAKEWDILGEPSYFGRYEYASPLRRWIVPVHIVVFGLMIVLVANAFGAASSLTVTDLMQFHGWLRLVLNLFYILLLLVADVIASFRRPRKDYSITISKDGLLYKDSDSEITSLWNEITAVQQPVGKAPIQIETKHGSFGFSTENPGYLTVRAALRRWADRSVVETWEAEQAE